MRLLVARCEVLYTGRLTARLPEAVRLLMFKPDGSFLVHDDAGGYRPLNWIRSAFRPEFPRGLRRFAIAAGEALPSRLARYAERFADGRPGGPPAAGFCNPALQPALDLRRD